MEWMAVTSTAGGSAGVYTYTVTRNLDGSGANTWSAGAAAVDTGTTGNGFIDLYSTAGVLSGTGPTIVGNVRTGTTYSNIAPRWAIRESRRAVRGEWLALRIRGWGCVGLQRGHRRHERVRMRVGTTNYAVLAASTLTIGASGGQRVAWDGTNLTVVSDTLTVDTNGVAVVPADSSSAVTKNGYRFTSATGDLGIFGSEQGGGTPSKLLSVLANGTVGNIIYIAALPATGLTLTGNSSTFASSASLLSDTISLQATGGVTVGAGNFTISGGNSAILTNGTTTSVFSPTIIGTSSAHNFLLGANGATVATVCNGGGLTIGSPTGGCQGAGTLNVSSALYLNGVAYTSPEPALQAMQAAIAGLEARLMALELAAGGR